MFKQLSNCFTNYKDVGKWRLQTLEDHQWSRGGTLISNRDWKRKDDNNVDLNNVSDLPTERALWVKWNIKNDQLGVIVNLREKPFTRHGMLSMISKTFDQLELVVPILLKGKIIFQDLCRNNYSWTCSLKMQALWHFKIC